MIPYQKLPPHTRAWIYQSNREFTPEEADKIKHELEEFVVQWTAHDKQLEAFGDVFYNRFIVFMIDEEKARASGCSIDKSVHLLKDMERKYGVSLFDRFVFAYKENGKVLTAGKEEFARLMNEGKISDDTVVFNNLVANKLEFEANWEVPLRDSWHKRLVS